MSFNLHEHRGEYAESHHYHDHADLYHVAEEHHSHHDLSRQVAELNAQVRGLQQRIGDLEDELRSVRCSLEVHEDGHPAG